MILFLQILPLTCLACRKCVYIYMYIYKFVCQWHLDWSPVVSPATHTHTHTHTRFFGFLTHFNQDFSSTVLTIRHVASDVWLVSVVFSKWNLIARWDQIIGLSCFLPFLKNEQEKKETNQNCFYFLFSIIRNVI